MHSNGQVISSAVRKAQDKFPSDADARNAVFAETDRSKALREALIWLGIKTAFSQQVRVLRARIRNDAWAPSDVNQTGISTPRDAGNVHKFRTRVKIQAKVAEIRYLAYPLPTAGNKPLGDATGQEIQAAANWYRDQGNSNLFEGRWLAAVARIVPEKVRAKTVITETQLADLRSGAAFREAAE